MSECRMIERALAEGAGNGERPLRLAELEHVAACAACRAAVAEVDPTILFSLLALERKDEAFWLGFDTRVRAATREEGRPRAGLLSLLPSPRTALLTCGAVLIAIVTLVARHDDRMQDRLAAGNAGPRVKGATSTAAPPLSGIEWVAGAARAVLGEEASAPDPSSRGPAPTVAGLEAGAHEAFPIEPLEMDAATPAPVETVFSPTAHIISLSIESGARQGPSRAGPAAATASAGSDVVLIVDREIDI